MLLLRQAHTLADMLVAGLEKFQTLLLCDRCRYCPWCGFMHSTAMACPEEFASWRKVRPDKPPVYDDDKEHRNPEPHSVEPQSFRAQSVEPQSFRSHSVEPQSFRSHSVEPHSFRPHSVEPRYIRPQSVESRYIRPQSVQPQSFRAKSVEPQSVRAESISEMPAARQSLLPAEIEGTSLIPESVRTSTPSILQIKHAAPKRKSALRPRAPSAASNPDFVCDLVPRIVANERTRADWAMAAIDALVAAGTIDEEAWLRAQASRDRRVVLEREMCLPGGHPSMQRARRLGRTDWSASFRASYQPSMWPDA